MHNQPTIALHQLHSECSTPLEDILRRLLSLGSTQQALAQIVDGIPTRDNYFGPPDSMWYQRHPDIAAHVISSEEASSSTSQFCSQLDLKTINVTATVGLLNSNKVQLLKWKSRWQSVTNKLPKALQRLKRGKLFAS